MIMDNRLLTFLETIENSFSISEASERLYISQPYISRVIKKAEDKYGVSLLDRNTRPIELTPAGHMMISYLRKQKELDKEFTKEVKKFNQSDLPVLRLGITPPLGEKFNLYVLPVLLNKYPNLRTKTVEISTADAEKLFKDNRLDLFVGNRITLPNVSSTSIYLDHQVLVLSKNSKLYQKDKSVITYNENDLSKINHEDFIFVDSEKRYQNIINNYFADIGISFYPRIHVRDSMTALKLTCLGLGDMAMSSKVIRYFKNQPVNFVKLPISKTGIDFSVSIKINPVLNDAQSFLVKILTENFENKISNFM